MVTIASAVTAFILGVWATFVSVAARIAYSQGRMQRKVDYWRREAVRRGAGPEQDAWRW